MAENGNSAGQQPSHQTSIMPPQQLYSAVENAFLKLKPKIHPPPPPPLKYVTLQNNPCPVPQVITLPEVQNSSFKTTVEQECTTSEEEHHWTTRDGWNMTDDEEQQWATTTMEAISEGEDQYPACATGAQYTFQEEPAPLNLHGHDSDYYCHCCGDQSLISALIDLY